jgi:hypothetical protein
MVFLWIHEFLPKASFHFNGNQIGWAVEIYFCLLLLLMIVRFQQAGLLCAYGSEWY